MIAPEMTLAVQDQFRDNKVHGEFDFLEDLAALMSGHPSGGRVWGDVEKDRLADLLSRSRKGDLRAAEDLYEIFKRPIFSLAFRHTLNQATAEDLLQDIFLKIFTHLRDVRDVKTFPAWIYRIALNTCYSHLRQNRGVNERTVPLSEIEGRTGDPGGEGTESDLRGPLEQAIQGLPDRLKKVFILHDVQGFKHHEISKILGCSVGTSKSQLFKARMKLRGVLLAREIV